MLQEQKNFYLIQVSVKIQDADECFSHFVVYDLEGIKNWLKDNQIGFESFNSEMLNVISESKEKRFEFRDETGETYAFAYLIQPEIKNGILTGLKIGE